MIFLPGVVRDDDNLIIVRIFPLISMLTQDTVFPLRVSSILPLTLDSIQPDRSTSPNTTAPTLPSAWPKLPYWTKIQDSRTQEFLDIYSTGPGLTSFEAYVLQEVVLFPLSFRVRGGTGTAESVESIRSGGVSASFTPNEHRPPSQEVTTKAIATLGFLEMKFAARTVKAGLRLGMVRVAGIEVSLVESEMV